MGDLEKKLQLKGGSLRVVNAPPGLRLDVSTADVAEDVLVFVRSRAELEEEVAPVLRAARADRLAWIAYPKGGRLGTDLNRDVLWRLLEGRGVRPVRQIAIDDVWSALRFRPGA